ncbi:hypothetical protein TTHERM_00028480 (macronuclear) [Tetrahymena thermophila SB210]|uniref:Uncharacterized protein n=1 Tax=Tetrahymena thermophila (strain SB210) TaxID=312017 RepID=Q22N26_TETTS|nr:hypothetical protein TTHERM_00028480 [Tetrahymena thermophila SB210]EAR86358.2 hypothetical protein TTHERM_00028480 [Tetrahymena thermophila SB210]|eukprot:XP_976844.2 hypothetical protein TTHERM_00028480 [Tetrahymena thermophila SB210]
MEINNNVIEGVYEKCYEILFQNLKNESDQRQMLEFMQLTKTKCLEIYQKRYTEYEQQITAKYNAQYMQQIGSLTNELEKQLIYERKVNQVYNEINQELNQKLQASLIFGSIFYSLGDFRLKQEKIKQQNLQSQNEAQKQKIDKLKKETVCLINMNKTKDDFILQLKDKVNALQKQSNTQSSNQEYSPPQFKINTDCLGNTPEVKNESSSLAGSSGSNKSLGTYIKELNEESNQSSQDENHNKIQEEKTEPTLLSITSDFDMYNYSFGKLFKNKSLHMLEEVNQQNLNIELPQQNVVKDSIKEEVFPKTTPNAQTQKKQQDFTQQLNTKQATISLFNSNSDQTLGKKIPSPIYNAKKSKEKYQIVNITPSMYRLKKVNSQSLSCNFSQGQLFKAEAEQLNEMVIEPTLSKQLKYQNQSSIINNQNSNQNFLNRMNNNDARSFIFTHKSHLKTQVIHNNQQTKKKI